jgi:hypothetical protein
VASRRLESSATRSARAAPGVPRSAIWCRRALLALTGARAPPEERADQQH